MKKRTTFLALGIILSSQFMPLMAHAEGIQVSTSAEKLSEASSHEIEGTDSNFEEIIATGEDTTSNSDALETISSELEADEKIEVNQYDSIEAITDSISDSTNIAEGVFGTSEWTIDASGTLHIGEGTFADTPANASGGVFGPWYQWRDQIYHVRFEGEVVAGKRLSRLFEYFSHVEVIEGIEKLDTSETTHMSRVFAECRSLKSLDLSSWDVSNATEIYSLFYGAEQMETLDVSTWDVSNVTSMSFTFAYMPKLKVLDLSQWKVTPLGLAQGVFMGDRSIESLDLSGFDMTKLMTLTSGLPSGYEMASFFKGATSLRSLKLGENFRFWSGEKANVELPEITKNNSYTGKWQNVSSGTSQKPAGTDLWTSDELVANFTSHPKNDTYVWQTRQIAGADITVRYLDENDVEIANTETLTGYVGEAYQSSQKDITGYSFKEVKADNANGVFTEHSQVVTYVYSRNSADVTVEYVDENGKPLTEAVILTGKFGENYSSEQKSFSGYTFKGVKEKNETGVFTDQAQTVTYLYHKDKEIVWSEVTVHYLDESDNQIADSIILTGPVGEAYHSDKKEISGYTFKETKGNIKGTFEENAQTIIYVYAENSKEEIVVPEEKDDKELNNSSQVQTSSNTSSTTSSQSNSSLSSNSARKLPETGSQSVVVPIFMGGLFLGIGTLLHLFKKRNNKKT